jgi:hypothetical protein
MGGNLKDEAVIALMLIKGMIKKGLKVQPLNECSAKGEPSTTRKARIAL